MNWISVKERLPDATYWNGCWHLVCDGDGRVEQAMFCTNGLWALARTDQDDRCIYVNATHWMPLPEPPK